MMRFQPAKHLMPIAAIVAWLAVPVGAAYGQATRPQGEEPASPSLSLQSQLGSIPLVSPRAGARAKSERVVRITQVAGANALGEARVINCPDTGCQQLVSLVVDNTAQSFLLDIQFVGHGAYVALQSRSAAIGGVVDFRQGKPGPVFIRGSAVSTSEAQLSFVTVASRSLRRLETEVDGRTVASGNVFNRKQAPDIVLRLVIERSKEK